MSGFDPEFDAAGAGPRSGIVPAPGAIDGRSHYLRADKTWAVPGSAAPGPEPPAPGPALDQWACNIAGYLTYEVSRLAVKYVVDWLPVSWLGDVAGGIVAGIAGALLPATLLVDGILEAAIFDWVSSYVSGHVVDIGTALLDDVAWAKIHCSLYDKIRLTPTNLHTAILALTAALGGLVGWTSPAIAAVGYLFEHLGITDVSGIPVSAFVRQYDCSSCAMTGIGPVKPLLQTSFDLTITDGTHTEPFTDTVDFALATVTSVGSTATVTPNTATGAALGVSRPDNSTVGITAGVLSVLATPAVTNLYSTVGTGTVYQLGSEPAGWQALAYDDSLWSAPVLETGGGPTPNISGAQRITSTNGDVSTSAVFLHRLTFSLAPGAVLAAVSTILEDNTSTVWVNGTEISTYTRTPTDTSGPHATSFDVSLLSTNNVLAIKIENGAFGGGANPMSVEYLLAITQAAHGDLTVEHNAAVVASRHAVNLTDGGGVSWTVADDPTHARVDISAVAVGFANPMTTAADLIVGDVAGAPSRLGRGSSGQVLTVDPGTLLLSWATPAPPGVGTVTSVGSTAPITATAGANPVVGLSTPLAGQYGGLGLDASGVSDGQIPIGGHSDHQFQLQQISAGTGITVTNSDHGISIAASGTGGGGTALTQLATVTVAVAVASVSISGISGGYTSLWVHWIARSTTNATAWDLLNMRVNSLSSAIYDTETMLLANTVSGGEGFGGTSSSIANVLQDGLASGFWTMGDILIPFYANTSTNKTIITRHSGDRNAGTQTDRGGEVFTTVRTTAAITELDFLLSAGNFKAGSQFVLYGVA